MDVYIDDMVVKSREKQGHIANLRQPVDILRQYKLKLNASKCVFGVSTFWEILGPPCDHNRDQSKSRSDNSFAEARKP